MVDHGETLSERARARMQADLPGLLGALRWRRRRRALVRAGIVVLLLVGTVLAWPALRAPIPAAVAPGPVAAPRWSTVQDDPLVLRRCTVPTTVRAEWFVDDQELQALLRAGDRPDGLVRVQDRVLVSATAIDPFPVPRP